MMMLSINSFFRSPVNRGTVFIIFLIIVSLGLGLWMSGIVMAKEISFPAISECMPWEVGQYVEYQVIHPESEGLKNRYKISLVGKEILNGKVYFWEKIDIYENVYFIKGELFRKNLTFLALIEPITSAKFAKDMPRYIQNGFFPFDAIKLKVQLAEGPFVEVDTSQYFLYQDIIEKTSYSLCPDALGRIDFSRMILFEKRDEITVPAGKLLCGHIAVKTNRDRDYVDEGLDLWRSPEIPLLGIVRMDFSQTLYWEKWSYRNEVASIKSIKDFFRFLLSKRVPGRRRTDTYTAQLIAYGR